MKRMVVGTDGSPGSTVALRWAAELAARHGAEILVMTGFNPANAHLIDDSVEDLLSEQRPTIESWGEAARLAGVPVRSVIETADPRTGILAVAEREGADLIVVGREGTSAGPGFLHMGNVGEWLAHHSPLPIAVVGGTVNNATQSVLVGVDGSKGSRVALEWVRDLAAVTAVRIVVASVEQSRLDWVRSRAREYSIRSHEDTIRHDYADTLTQAGVVFDVVALRGPNIADRLLDTASAEQTDVIVVGARGLGGFTGLRLGGVAIKMLHRSDRPIVLIPDL